MTAHTTPNRPTHRVSFSRIAGTDDQGADILGPAREIGAVWPRKTGVGGILRLDIIPIELTQRQGVLFLTPLPEDETGVV